jgi:hypothetical protein
MVDDYHGAAEEDREARRDWHDARRQDNRAQDEQGGVVVGARRRKVPRSGYEGGALRAFSSRL